MKAERKKSIDFAIGMVIVLVIMAAKFVGINTLLHFLRFW